MSSSEMSGRRRRRITILVILLLLIASAIFDLALRADNFADASGRSAHHVTLANNLARTHPGDKHHDKRNALAWCEKIDKHRLSACGLAHKSHRRGSPGGVEDGTSGVQLADAENIDLGPVFNGGHEGWQGSDDGGTIDSSHGGGFSGGFGGGQSNGGGSSGGSAGGINPGDGGSGGSGAFDGGGGAGGGTDWPCTGCTSPNDAACTTGGGDPPGCNNPERCDPPPPVTPTTSAVPEPSTLIVFAMGLALLLARCRWSTGKIA